MLCKLQNVKKLCLRAGFLSLLFFIFFIIAATVWAPMAKAQAPGSEQADGKISGSVLLKANNRPASQVAVKLKSHAAGIFRRDRKSTRLNSSHRCISYAVFCLKKKNRSVPGQDKS